MPKGFGSMGQMMRDIQKQAQKMQKQIEEVQEDLKERIVDASAGGGMVTAYVNGQQELVSIKIDKEVVNPDDVEMLEDLIIAAVTQAMKKAQELSQQEMSKVTGGLNIPGLSGLFG